MKSIKDIKELLCDRPRLELGFYPTPFYKLERLSEELGINLFIKRDDFSGQNLFGGNKIRKLEYILGDAKAKGAEYVFTYGATQSNHAMQTVWAARKVGLKPIIYLVAIVEPDESDVKANMLLDMIFDAEIHIIKPKEGESILEADDRALEQGKAHIARLEAEGHKCYDIPIGGASPIGTTGYIGGYIELQEQMNQMGVHADYLIHATGTGSTMAGLVAGKKLLGEDLKIISIDSSNHPDNYKAISAALGNQALSLLGIESILTAEDFCNDLAYYLPGYEQPSEGGTEAIKMLATREGILLDPVYSGKGFAGLIDYVRSGKIPQGSTVVFLHTGGATALFAEREILGDIF